MTDHQCFLFVSCVIVVAGCCCGLTYLTAHFYILERILNVTFFFYCWILWIYSYLLCELEHSFVHLCKTSSKLFCMLECVHWRLSTFAASTGSVSLIYANTQYVTYVTQSRFFLSIMFEISIVSYYLHTVQHSLQVCSLWFYVTWLGMLIGLYIGYISLRFLGVFSLYYIENISQLLLFSDVL